MNIYFNCSTSDVPLGTSGVDWVEFDEISDKLLLSKGSDVVADGLAIPTETQLNSAGLLLTGLEQTVSKYFLMDNSAGILKQIDNMGSGNKRYVIAFDFDAATASEPVLEIWDNEDYDSIDNISLGEGSASSSWWRGITTTDGLPGVGWTGNRLAGSADSHFLYLNNENGALTGPTTLYAQLKVVIPATITEAGSENPVLIVKYATV